MSEPKALQRMAVRVEQCGPLGDAATDERTRAVLLRMGDEIEQDMKGLEAER